MQIKDDNSAIKPHIEPKKKFLKKRETKKRSKLPTSSSRRKIELDSDDYNPIKRTSFKNKFAKKKRFSKKDQVESSDVEIANPKIGQITTNDTGDLLN